jgi:hypothetical protein
MTEIKEGANGLYVDDGENLHRVDQSGNGSDKVPTPEEIARRLEPGGD